MRIAIYGTGGVGGYFGARLALAGEDVVFIARGAHLAAIRDRGLRLVTPTEDLVVSPCTVTDDPTSIGTVDVILYCLKTFQLTDAARASEPMLGPDTFAVPLQNGVDAPADLAAVIGRKRVLGGTCGTISRVSEPGVITSVGAVNFVRFGELDNRRSDRVGALRAVFSRSGVQVEVPDDIHAAMWEKFVFVVSMGGVGAVARAPIGVTRTMPGTRGMLEASMREISAVAAARGVALEPDIVERRMAFVDSLAYDGTTSLQRDIAEGRPSELEAWNGAVVRIGCEVGVPTPINAFCYYSLLAQEMQNRPRS